METDGKRFKLTKSNRLVLNRDFQKVFECGKLYRTTALTIYVLPTDNKVFRLGIVTSRKLGNAVKRNLIKRRLREIFRLNKHRFVPAKDMSGYDMIFLPQKSALNLSYTSLENIVFNIWKRANLIS